MFCGSWFVTGSYSLGLVLWSMRIGGVEWHGGLIGEGEEREDEGEG
jgi:hypothetical protein